MQRKKYNAQKNYTHNSVKYIFFIDPKLQKDTLEEYYNNIDKYKLLFIRYININYGKTLQT